MGSPMSGAAVEPPAPGVAASAAAEVPVLDAATGEQSVLPPAAKDAPAWVHPTSVCDAGASLGVGTRVWHFCHVMAGAQIGRRCSLGQGCFVGRGVRLGDGCRVQNHVSLFEGVTFEDDVFCGPSVVFTNVTRPRAAHSAVGYEPTRVRRGASLGANATIRCGVTLGEYCFVGAGALVLGDVPAYAQVQGVPAAQVGWVSRRGEALRFDAEQRAVCPASGEHYVIDGAAVRLEEPT